MKALLLTVVIAITSVCAAQTTLTGQITDTDGLPWAGAFVNITAQGPIPPGTPSKFSAVANSSGAYSVSLPFISLGGGQWQFQITAVTSNGVSIPSVYTANAVAIMNGTQTQNFVPPGPRFPDGAFAYGYGTVEVQPLPAYGVIFQVQPSITSQWYTASGWASGPGGGGGGNLPTAISAGQIITSTGSGTTYAVQGQVFYSQSGDTIASIESECSSLCTYIVTVPQTMTLAASHSLSSNVNLVFEGGGEWTVNGAFTLTISTQVQGALTQHFAGTSTIAFGLNQAVAPVEWFGAVGNGTLSGSGTNNLTPIQNTLNALNQGCALLQTEIYAITGTLTISASNVGICGANPAIHVFGKTGPTIINTSASDDTVDVAGTSGTYIASNKFTNVSFQRSVAPSGTASGLSIQYCYGCIVDYVTSDDSIRGFYFHGMDSGGIGYVRNVNAYWGYNGFNETTTVYGFYLDSADGTPNNSIRLENTSSGTNGLSGITSYGVYIYGSQINDAEIRNCESAEVSYGASVTYTSGGSGFAAGDIHFWDCIQDKFYVNGYSINNLTNGQGGSLEISGGWASSSSSTSPAIAINGSQGVMVEHVMTSSNATTGVIAILDGSEWNTIVNNTIGGFYQTTPTNGIYLDSTSLNNLVYPNTYLGIETSTTAPPVSDGTAGGNPINYGRTRYTSPIDNTPVVEYFSNDYLNYPAFVIGPGAIVGLTPNETSPTAGYGLGYAAPSTAAGSNPTFSTYNGSGWTPGWSLTKSTGVLNALVGANLPIYTVSTLPSASTLGAGTMVEVSDGAGTPPTCTGSGSNYQIAVSNGSSWSCH